MGEQGNVYRQAIEGGKGMVRALACTAVVGVWLLSACGGSDDPPAATPAASLEAPAGTGPAESPAEPAAFEPAVRLTGTVLPGDPHINAFGTRTVLSDDGNTLAVSGHADLLNPLTGQIEWPHLSWGSVHVFRRTRAGAWQQTAVIRPIVGPEDEFGGELALSGDGRTLVVGAPRDRGRARGVGGDPYDRTPRPSSGVITDETGAVWVYSLQANRWVMQAYIKAPNPDNGDYFGQAVALSRNGNWMAVGASGEASSSRGIDAGPCNEDAPASGAVYVFQRDFRGGWHQREFVKASNADAGDRFGTAVALSSDGDVLAVGAHGEASAADHPDGNQADDSQPLAGAAYVFERGRNGRLAQTAYLKAQLAQGPNMFGYVLSLSASGDVLAVGAQQENAQPVSTSVLPSPDQRGGVGRVYVFGRRAGSPYWQNTAVLSASNAGIGDRFGSDVKLSGDARTLAVGAWGEDGGIPGVDVPQHDDSMLEAGAIYVFRLNLLRQWRQRAYVKLPTVRPWGAAGYSMVAGLGLDAAGDTLVVGDREGNTYCAGCPENGGGSAFLYDVR